MTTNPTIHCYDTELRRILCGVRGPDHRSTKHPRGVTCETCLALLTERTPAAPPADASAGHAAA